MKATNRPLTVAAVLASSFMAAVEVTVVSTAMPTVTGDLGGVHLYSWVFAAYLLASTVTVPLYGKLADLRGRRPVMLFGLAVFTAGSVASGLATSMHALVVFRAIQGLGAGAIQPVALTILGDLFTVQERARVQGYFSAVWGAAGLAGPALGGLIVAHLSWRWIFFLNVPAAVAAAVLFLANYHEKPEPHEHRLDLAGAALLTLAMTALLAGADPRRALWCVPAAALLLVAFVRVELRAPEPVLSMELMTRRVMAASSVASALAGAAMMTTTSFVPLFVQGVLGGSATDAAKAVTPMTVGWPVASVVAGRLIPRWGFRPLVVAGSAVSAGAALAMALFLGPHAPLWVAQASTAAAGVGMGLANTALLIAVQSSVEWRQRGMATAGTMFFRTIGGTLLVGLAGGVLAASLAGDASIPPGAADELLGPERGRHLDAALLLRISGALQEAMGGIFWMVAVAAALSFAASLLFPHGAAEEHGGAAKR